MRQQGEHRRVLFIAREYLLQARKIGDKASEALFLKIHAQIESDNGHFEESVKIYKQIERIYIELGDQQRQMHTLRHIGTIYHELGKLECAEKCLAQVVGAYQKNLPSRLEAANAYRIYAIVLEELEQVERAAEYWEKAKSHYLESGVEDGVKECNMHLSHLH